MPLSTAIPLLLVAALLEAGGDALVRLGLQGSGGVWRTSLFAAAGLVLFAYGYVVNAPRWDFGRLMGLYIVLFFLVAQAIAWAVFGNVPTRGVLLGGALIVAGGAIVAVSVN